MYIHCYASRLASQIGEDLHDQFIYSVLRIAVPVDYVGYFLPQQLIDKGYHVEVCVCSIGKTLMYRLHFSNAKSSVLDVETLCWYIAVDELKNSIIGSEN